jgi:hypothetical protein
VVVEHVAGDGDGLATERADLLSDGVGAVRDDVDQRHVAAGASEEQRRAFAHALAAADDEALLAGQAEECGFWFHRCFSLREVDHYLPTVAKGMIAYRND